MFPGESIPLDGAAPISGTFPDGWFGGPITYRRDGQSTTLTSGGAFLAGFSEYSQLPSGSEPVAASVVIVTGAASSGTVTVSVGTDPSFDLDDPGLATQDLGSQSATGEQTLVFTIPTFDVAAFYTYASQFIAYVQVTAGTVEFTQVKLRLWPPDGPRGAWVLGTETSALGGAELIRMAAATPSAGDGVDVAEAYAEAVSNWNGGGPVLAYLTSEPAAQGRVSLTFNGINFSSIVTLSVVSTWAGATGVGAVVESTPESLIAHPDEVPDEAGALVGDVSGNPVVYGFGGWTSGTIEVLSGTGLIGDDPAPPSAAGVVQMTPGAAIPDTWLDGGNYYTDRFGPPESGEPIPPSTVASPDSVTTAVDLPSTPTFQVTVASYSWYNQPLDNYTDGGGGSYSYFGAQNDQLHVADLESILTIPTHYIWDPEASPVQMPLRIRQRGDGLGMGGPRVRGVGSRQRSPRVRGYV